MKWKVKVIRFVVIRLVVIYFSLFLDENTTSLH